MSDKLQVAGQATEDALKASAKAKNANLKTNSYFSDAPTKQAPSERIKLHEEAQAAHEDAMAAHHTARDAHKAVGHDMQADQHDKTGDDHQVEAISHKRQAKVLEEKSAY